MIDDDNHQSKDELIPVIKTAQQKEHTEAIAGLFPGSQAQASTDLVLQKGTEVCKTPEDVERFAACQNPEEFKSTQHYSEEVKRDINPE